MKVGGADAARSIAGARTGTRSAEPGFSAQAAAAPASASASRVAAATALTSVDALLALQETPEPIERRRRAVRRAGRILDVLDELKLALLDGPASPGLLLQRLNGAVSEARSQTDDPGLEGVLDEIETRAAVELAKQEAARRAA